MLVEFYYRNKKNETKLRKVFVVRDCSTCFEGIDVNLLETDEMIDLLKRFGSLKPSHSEERTGNKIDGWNDKWNKAWRRFNKSGIL